MINDSFFMTFLTQLAWSLPTLLVCIIGIVILQSRALARKAKALAVAGLALVVLGAFGGIAFNLYLSGGGMDYSSVGFRYTQMAYGALMQVLHVASLVLLIMAICNKDKPATTNHTAENPYQ